ncbi:MAG: hypothetical protein JWP04_2923 [Belnapia sp.]|nr:hypothetical protein [Belnapia sp.]
MKPFVIGLVAAASLAALAALVLDGEFQRSATDHFQTESVRL